MGISWGVIPSEDIGSCSAIALSESPDAVREIHQDYLKFGEDIMLPEYVGYLNGCQRAVDVCSEVGLPVFLGTKDVDRYMKDPSSIVRGLEGRRVDVILARCTPLEVISERLPALRKTFGV